MDVSAVPIHQRQCDNDDSHVDKSASATKPICVDFTSPLVASKAPQMPYERRNHDHNEKYQFEDRISRAHSSWNQMHERSNSNLSLFDEDFKFRDGRKCSWGDSRELIHDVLFDDNSLFDIDALEKKYGDVDGDDIDGDDVDDVDIDDVDGNDGNDDDIDGDDVDGNDDDISGETNEEEENTLNEIEDRSWEDTVCSPSKTERKIYALRQGLHTRACIYFNWNAFCEQITGFPQAEFAIFDNMDSASQYLLSDSAGDHNGVVTLHSSQKIDHDQKENNLETRQQGCTDGTPTTTFQSDYLVITSSSNDLTQETTSTRRKLIAGDTEWMTMFSKLKKFRELKCTNNVQETEDSELNIWIKDQRQEYRKYKEGKESNLTENKICLLNSINFQFQNRGKYISWRAHFEAYKVFKDKYGTEYSPSPNTPLARWIYSARKNYRLYQQGVTNHNLTHDRIQMLDEIGFEWIRPKNTNYFISEGKAIIRELSKESRKSMKWMAMFEELKKYKEKYGTADVPSRQGSLGRWAMNQRKFYKLYREDENNLLIDKEKITLLSNIGFTLDWKENKKKKEKVSTASAQAEVKPECRWEEMYEQLRHFRDQNGNCNVPMKLNSKLRKWMLNQRKEFLKSANGEESLLSANRIERLSSLGFNFNIKPVLTWDQRFEQLLKFKEEFGHVRVPRQHQGLGKWIAEQRLKYRLYTQGQSTNMTSDQIKRLNDVGMVWQILKISPQNKRAIRKPWDVRFQELIEYKERYGHTKVPQSSPYLGNWVHQQRTHYKLMIQGKKSLMTPARAEKLNEIGFIFEVKPRRSLSTFVCSSSDTSRADTPMTIDSGDMNSLDANRDDE